MRRRLAILVSVALVTIAVWALRERGDLGTGRGGGGAGARIDRGAAVEGDRGRIDPHGPAAIEPMSSPLSIQAQVEARSGAELRVAVEVSAGVPFDSVVVRAARYDVAGALEPGWSGVVWTGSLQPGAAAHFEARVPLGSADPTRVQVGVHATGPGGARHTATAIVRPEAGSP